MMATLKKVILFLFGIVLVVFGNKAAINTIFGDKENTEVEEIESSDAAAKVDPVIVEDDSASTPVPDEKLESEKTNVQSEKTKPAKEVEKTKIESKTKSEKIKDVKKEEVKEAPKTTIESDNSESATATE